MCFCITGCVCQKKNRDYEDSNLDEEYRSNSIIDVTLLSVSDSSSSRSEISEVSSVDSTSIIDEHLRIVAHAHEQMETGIEDSIMQSGKTIANSRFE